MGLDNGFYVVSDKRKITRDILPSTIKYPFEKDYNDNVEIVYWRKNWGLRNEVLDVVHSPKGDSYYYTIETPQEVMNVIGIIASFLDPEKWERDGNSIWEADEVRPKLIYNIINLAIVMEFMENNPDVYLQFYDSY